MLVLNRKRNQSIRIGNDILVNVCEIKATRVRLAIQAPPNIRICRDELADRDAKSPVSLKPCGQMDFCVSLEDAICE